MTMRPELHGLYVITDAGLIPPERLEERVAAAIRGGARIVQYRDKTTEHERRLAEAARLQALCARAGAALIINDDVELARETGAAGVHIGEDDAALDEARARLGPQAIIGVSCYDDLARARVAQAAGADYVAFGAFFPSPTKPNARTASLDLLVEAKHALGLPVCAIGGIRAEHAPRLIAAGADMLAVITAVFAARDVEAAAREIARAFAD